MYRGPGRCINQPFLIEELSNVWRWGAMAWGKFLSVEYMETVSMETEDYPLYESTLWRNYNRRDVCIVVRNHRAQNQPKMVAMLLKTGHLSPNSAPSLPKNGENGSDALSRRKDTPE